MKTIGFYIVSPVGKVIFKIQQYSGTCDESHGVCRGVCDRSIDKAFVIKNNRIVLFCLRRVKAIRSRETGSFFIQRRAVHEPFFGTRGCCSVYHPQMSMPAITDTRIEEDMENIDSMPHHGLLIKRQGSLSYRISVP